MKKNCLLCTAQELYATLFASNPGTHTELNLSEDGVLSWLQDGNTRLSFPPNDLAYRLNMPLWEVVMVDELGEDEYALLFYEN